MINIDDFAKIELKIAKVVSAERIEGSEKLLRIQLFLGQETSDQQRETRQILAGIGKAYTPEELIGKEVVIVANLEPREMMGMMSQGMLLAAQDAEGKPVILIPEREVPPGSLIR